MSKHIILTLDGPAGVGKTTMARKLADYLKIAYLDTGAMFRGIAYLLGQEALHYSDTTLQTKLLEFKFDLKKDSKDNKFVLSLNNRKLGPEIRTEEVGMLASALATKGVVREFLKQAQREIGKRFSLVAEGRDMGTVVFKDASLKFFLDATPEERARRRLAQLKMQGIEVDYKKILEQIIARDRQDRTRKIAPLCPAQDAIVIDTTDLSLEDVFNALKKHLSDFDLKT